MEVFQHQGKKEGKEGWDVCDASLPDQKAKSPSSGECEESNVWKQTKKEAATTLRVMVGFLEGRGHGVVLLVETVFSSTARGSA